MRLPQSPLSIFATLCALIVPAGVGLTAPVWLMVMGIKLDVAAGIGARIVGVTVLACAALAGAYFLVLRPRLEPAAPAGPDLGREHNPLRDRLVHSIVWALFVVPFVLIILGFIIGQLEKVVGVD